MKIKTLLALLVASGSLPLCGAVACAQSSGSLVNTHFETAMSASQPTADATQVQAVLSGFGSALASRDVAMLESTGITHATAKRWQHFFKSNPSATVTDTCSASDLVISEGSASWSCTETATVVFEGKLLSYAQPMRFTFQRNDGVWMIADRQAISIRR